MATLRNVGAAVVAAASAVYAAPPTITVSVNTLKAQHTVAHPFLAYNIDTGSIYNNFNFSEPKLQNIIAQLGPTILRIGGTAADYSYYLPNDPRAGDGNGHTILNNTVWDSIISMIQNTMAVQLMWDFDSLRFRDANGNFDPTGNATAQLDYLQSKYGGKLDIIWTTGNEPDLWPKPWGSINGTMLARDAVILAETVAKYDLGKTVYGPAYAGFNHDAQEFMTAAKANPAVAGFTCHNYPLGGHSNCNVPAYLDPTPLRNMGKSVAQMAAAKAASGNTDMVLALEETGGSYQGGCDNITNRFISGFWYINAMGQVAYNGMDRLHRQDIAGWSFTGGISHYELAGPPGWTNGADSMMPHPDWYSAVLHKQLIGRHILTTSVSGPASTNDVGLYVWCGATGPEGPGGIVVVFTNPTGSDVVIDLTASGIPNAPRQEWVLTSAAADYDAWAARVASNSTRADVTSGGPPSTIQADEVYLNGALLAVDPATALLPAYPVPGKVVGDPSSPITLPPYSYGFIGLTGAAPTACSAE